MKHIYRLAKLYSANNRLQYQFALSALKDTHIKTRARILDIGCGDGKITRILAKSARLGSTIGTDISPQMVEHARKIYADIHNLAFMQMDAERNVFKRQFDVITSFNCLHWVSNQRKALQGISNAAAPGAQVVLLLSHRKSDYHLSFDEVCTSDKWHQYFKDVQSPRQFFSVEGYSKLLASADLTIDSIEEKEMSHRLGSSEMLKSFCKASSSQINSIPPEHQDAFLNDYMKAFLKRTGQSASGAISLRFWNLRVLAHRPSLKQESANDDAPAFLSKL